MLRKRLAYQLCSGGALSLLLLLATRAAPRAIAVSPQQLPQSASFERAFTSGRSNFSKLALLQDGKVAAITQPEQQFIIIMVPYQKDAIALADAALSHAKHPEIKALARTIKQTQTSTNQQLRSLYQRWYGTDVPDSLQLPEMATNTEILGIGGAMQADLTELETAPDFDRAFLEEMMQHQQMGVAMAQNILTSGDRPELRTLAEAIIQSQNAHIDTMQYWYHQWYLAGNREP